MVGDARAVLRRLQQVESAVRAAVARHRESDPQPDDPFRGLYLSDETVDAALAAGREPFSPWRTEGPSAVTRPGADADAGQPSGDRLAALAGAARLTPLDEALLLVALAPDVDSRFEQFYGYLNDDVTRRRPSVGLALRLCGLPEAAASARLRLTPGAPLIDLALLRVDSPDRPVLSRGLWVPDRVGGWLLGADAPEPLLAGLAGPAQPAGPPPPGAQPLARALDRAEARLAYLRERPGGSAVAVATAALDGAGRAALVVDLPRLAADPQPAELATVLVREALLTGAGLVVGPVQGGEPWAVWSRLIGGAVPVLAYGTQPWDPAWTAVPPLQVEVAPLTVDDRAAVWRDALPDRLAAGLDPAAATAQFVLGAPAIRRAAQVAAQLAAAEGTPIGEAHLRAGARTQNAAGLERLARRIVPEVGWDDLVLPPATLSLLRELAGRARHRDQVLRQWRMRPGGGRGHGVTALFAGDSGTGKTMSAEVVAGSLGLDLYTVNLATVVDKYVGETEKNLERIFGEAAGVNGVLLFDEADAIFGKRSEVRDAHDRYANIESAYLLQRMETFDGLAVLATNLRANLDEAFTRRLDVVVDFPVPDEAARRALWDRCLGPRVPRAADVDLDFLAAAFELAGGHIRSAAVTAGYLAAEAGRPVGMAELIGAVGREYRKLGRLTLESEFGRWLPLAVG
ncbi:ATPase family associated with various cellular activities (AAA) [Micromonospora viridifaciens]|uniref:ATPase family associated with various cellular activities (AAA) n=1 Tax=Micromonospora viridifaciens TaxID=1881 RepID=A0A1C4X3W4_MICVI|nr:ATP-binding protein [Micromonospora viridifaciens]SCF03157.1 ATPase family associated with various cellular activities (AAA) [Micromonospora viridifaciens]